MKQVYEPEKHRRRSIRLKGYDYSQAGAYFVTVCTHNREYLFGNVVNDETVLSRYGKIVENVWYNLTNHYLNIKLDASVVMPNHIHGIIILMEMDNVGAGFKPAPTDLTKYYPLSEIIRAFKTFSARHVNELRITPGIPVWQRNYHEHIVRNENELNRIREYIVNNPLQWQFDRENPDRIVVAGKNVGAENLQPLHDEYIRFEEIIFGKK
jgi:REP element-mobilizing transposase RayT